MIISCSTSRCCVVSECEDDVDVIREIEVQDSGSRTDAILGKGRPPAPNRLRVYEARQGRALLLVRL